jgi:hypothetical protein
MKFNIQILRNFNFINSDYSREKREGSLPNHEFVLQFSCL